MKDKEKGRQRTAEKGKKNVMRLYLFREEGQKMKVTEEKKTREEAKVRESGSKMNGEREKGKMRV